MTAFDSGAVKLDPVGVQLRTFAIRVRSLEKLFTTITRANAEPGRDGKDGVQGRQGMQGAQGEQGPPGPPPAHEWEGTSLRFENPDGSWGPLVDLQGPAGPPKYFAAALTESASSWEPSGW